MPRLSNKRVQEFRRSVGGWKKQPELREAITALCDDLLEARRELDAYRIWAHRLLDDLQRRPEEK